MFSKNNNRGFSKKSAEPSKLSLLFTLAMFFMIAVGVWLRLSETPRYLNVNIPSYYYHRSNYLLEHGALPQKDIWGFAPKEMMENVPPALAYVTVVLFGIESALLSFFGRAPDFLEFVLKLPAIFYLFWALAGMFLMKKVFSKEAIFVFIILLTFLPFSVAFTQGGKYSEELVGAPALFFMLIFLLRFIKNDSPPDLSGFFVSALLLALSWPQFPAPFAAAALTGFVMLPTQKKNALLVLGGLATALLSGHFLSIHILGIAYSPLWMLGEAWQGLWSYHDSDMLLALERTDWVNANPFDFFRFFGGLGILLFFLGVLRSVVFRDKLKDVTLLIFSGIGLVLFSFFLKSSSLFLPIFVTIAAYGGEMVLSRSRMDEFVFEPARRVSRIWWARFLAKIALAVFTGILIALAVDYFFWVSQPRPVGALSVSGFFRKMTPGVSHQVEVRLLNAGAPTLKEKNAFAGLHIEVKNALVKNIRAISSSGGRVVIKPNAVSEEWFWFETAFPRVDRSGQASAAFVVTPLSDDFEIRVRGWLPGSCSLISRLRGTSERTGPYWNPFTEGWRSESCLVRIPVSQVAESDTAAPCAIDVFAGYRSLQTFKCQRYFLK